jgi:proline racemase
MKFDRAVVAVDAHAEGEPGRVIIGGVLDPPGQTVFDKMQHFQKHSDALRLLMLKEPRGYPALCCNVIVSPTRPEAAAGFIIMEQSEYPPMSGSNTICVSTVLIEMGMVPVTEPTTEFVLETPAGLVKITARVEQNRARSITFENVPAFVFELDVPIEVAGIGTVKVDIAYGGMVYAIFDGSGVGLRLTPDEAGDIVRIGEMVRRATREQRPVVHPDNERISGPTIALISGPPDRPDADLKNVVVVSSDLGGRGSTSSLPGAVDRSPCGTGTCARMASLYARGKLRLNQEFHHEGILGTKFIGRIVGETVVGRYPAIVPAITGSGWITGISTYVLDPEDPFPNGFTVGDIWPK